MRPSESPETSIVSRREAIRRAALLAGVALSPEWLAIVGRAQSAAAKTYLDARRKAPSLAPLADRILPRTDTPGAADVGVPAFIDLPLRRVHDAGRAAAAHPGLDEVEAAAKSAHGAGVRHAQRRLSRTPCCAAIATAQQDRDPGSFALIRSATMLGYFTSEQVGRNVLHYDPVPGGYDGCVPIDQVGRRNWTT